MRNISMTHTVLWLSVLLVVAAIALIMSATLVFFNFYFLLKRLANHMQTHHIIKYYNYYITFHYTTIVEYTELKMPDSTSVNGLHNNNAFCSKKIQSKN